MVLSLSANIRRSMDRTNEATGRLVAASCLLAALVFAAFFPALTAEFLFWDDQHTIVDNPHIRTLDGATVRWAFSSFLQGHYQPLTSLSLALDHAVWGLRPFGFHLTNLLLHAANAVLVLLLLRTFLPRAGLLPILLGAAAWALHPMRVESVVWATERRDVLSAAFLLAALLVWRRASSPHRRPTAFALALGLSALYLLYVCSLLSKAVGMTFPLVLLLIALWERAASALDAARAGAGAPAGAWFIGALCRGALRRVLATHLPPTVPLFALALATGLIAIRAQRAAGALAGSDMIGLSGRLALAAHSALYTLVRPFWPFDLSPLYPVPLRVSWSDQRFWGALLLLGLLATLGVSICRWRPKLGLALLCGGTLQVVLAFPTLGLAQSSPALVADRYSYLPAIVLSFGLAAWLDWLGGGGYATSRARARLAPVLGASLVLSLGAASFSYAQAWHDTESLWRAALAAQPGCGYCRVELAAERIRRGDPGEAEALLREALHQRPHFHGYALLATILANSNRGEEAIPLLLRAATLSPGDPAPLELAARITEHAGETGSALELRRLLVSRFPSDARLRLDLVRSLLDWHTAPACAEAAALLTPPAPRGVPTPEHDAAERARLRAVCPPPPVPPGSLP